MQTPPAETGWYLVNCVLVGSMREGDVKAIVIYVGGFFKHRCSRGTTAEKACYNHSGHTREGEPMTTPHRRQYLISITENDRTKRTAMRNALHRHGAREMLPGVFVVALTEGERRALARRFGGARIRVG